MASALGALLNNAFEETLIRCEFPPKGKFYEPVKIFDSDPPELMKTTVPIPYEILVRLKLTKNGGVWTHRGQVRCYEFSIEGMGVHPIVGYAVKSDECYIPSLDGIIVETEYLGINKVSRSLVFGYLKKIHSVPLFGQSFSGEHGWCYGNKFRIPGKLPLSIRNICKYSSHLSFLIALKKRKKTLEKAIDIKRKMIEYGRGPKARYAHGKELNRSGIRRRCSQKKFRPGIWRITGSPRKKALDNLFHEEFLPFAENIRPGVVETIENEMSRIWY